MDLTNLEARERLIAEQAVLAFRESIKAMEAAPHGRGLAVTERAVQEQVPTAQPSHTPRTHIARTG